MTAAADRDSNPRQKDAASYDTAAAGFAQLTERFGGPVAELMLDVADIHSADRVLDVGTGTGLVARRAARRAQDGSVIGVDHAAGMLAQAQVLGRAAGQAVAYAQMDAMALGLPTASFDVVLSLFLLKHLPDPSRGIAEMLRVLRPGGRIVIGVGGGPPILSRNLPAWALARLRERVAALDGRLLMAPQFLRGLMSEHAMATPPVLAEQPVSVGRLLRHAKSERVRCSWIGRATELSPQEFWDVQATFPSRERMALQSASPDQVRRLRRDFDERVAAVQARSGRLIYVQGAQVWSAIRSLQN